MQSTGRITSKRRFEVQLSNLSAAATYEVIVASDSAALGIGGYGAAARARSGWSSEVPAGRDTSGTGTTHTVTGLTNGVKYHLRVTPCNQAKGCLPWSDQVGSSHASVSGTPQGGVTAPGQSRTWMSAPAMGNSS